MLNFLGGKDAKGLPRFEHLEVQGPEVDRRAVCFNFVSEATSGQVIKS